MEHSRMTAEETRAGLVNFTDPCISGGSSERRFKLYNSLLSRD
jgi:hypothetical protein